VFRVSRNLHSALRELRHAKERGVIWIDAICINQSNDVEKGHQVSQMERIYSVAQKVVIWLGEGNEASDLGMESVTLLLQMATSRTMNTKTTEEGFAAITSSVSSLLALPDFESRLSGLVELFGRPWWFRVWTLQEITPAKNAVLHCGERQMEWLFFEIIAQAFQLPQVLHVLASHQLRSEVGRKAASALPGLLLKVSAIVGLKKAIPHCGTPLEALAIITGERLATNPRDKIYALLGICTDRYGITPGYSFTVSICYSTSFKAMLQNSMDVSILGLSLEDPGTRDSTVPAWVPDLQAVSRRRRLAPISQGTSEDRGFTKLHRKILVRPCHLKRMTPFSSFEASLPIPLTMLGIRFPWFPWTALGACQVH
jgi:Heterokaryon incompatibility protein (HET)